MSAESQLYKINLSSNRTEAISEVDFASLKIEERRHIQEWIADNSGLLGEKLLIISKEFDQFDKTAERLDLLAVDDDGRLVIIELKRDDSGKDAHWQALKYGSYINGATLPQIARILAKHRQESSEEEAMTVLAEHVGADDSDSLADILNTDPRIILASHRFAPEVTSTALWLNEKVPGLFTCIKLTPYQDEATGQLYLHTNTVIPIPGTEPYTVGVGKSVFEQQSAEPRATGQSIKNQHRNDEVSQFLKKTRDLLLEKLPVEIRPDKRSWWAGDGGGYGKFNRRHFHFWYNEPEWDNWTFTYAINVYNEREDGKKKADVGLMFRTMPFEDVESILRSLGKSHWQFRDMWGSGRNDEMFSLHYSEDLDDTFAQTLSGAMCDVISIVTPALRNLTEEENEEGDSD